MLIVPLSSIFYPCLLMLTDIYDISHILNYTSINIKDHKACPHCTVIIINETTLLTILKSPGGANTG